MTVFGLEAGSRQIADQTSRTAHALWPEASAWGWKHAGIRSSTARARFLLVISPEHADTIARDGWSKAQVRARIQEVTSRPLRELIPDAESGEGVPLKALGFTNPTPEQLEQRIPKFRKPENINIIVAGGEAGKFSAVFAGWVSGSDGLDPASAGKSRRANETGDHRSD